MIQHVLVFTRWYERAKLKVLRQTQTQVSTRV
jgi:hypothetical protein